ncbi:MAG: glycosyltransferase family 2 protein [Rubrobacteraceae bacterium]|nr:glycosyltransferase family 2 protein [Rubrobacteraceae bacterium]
MAVGLSTLDVEYVHGRKEVPLREEELVVVCLVRDGQTWLEAFIEHYFSLGAKHIVFLDNGSSDATVSVAASYDNVTVLRSTLPFKRYELLLRQYLIERFGRGRWSLCVDVDELFDYPYSDVIGLDSLLGYLNTKSYTAVAAQMLDMFPEESLAGGAGRPEESFRARHILCDLSALRRKDIDKHSGRNNVFDGADIDCLAGGIRETVFGVMPRLTKFPLVFSDGAVKPVEESPHHIGNATIADISCVLFHYKYVGRFHEQTARAVREENHWNDSAQYKQYLEVLEKNPRLALRRETSREIKSTNDLLEEQFLVVSDDYVSWVDAEEARMLPGTGQHATSEALLRARRLERAKTLRIQRLEKQLRDLGRQVEESRRTKRRLRRRVRALRQRLESTDPEAGSETT